MKNKTIRIIIPVLLVVLVLTGVTGGIVTAASRAAHQEYWRVVYSVQSLETMQTSVGRGLSLVKEHSQTEVYDVFPAHAVLFDFDSLRILVSEGTIQDQHPITLQLLAVSDQGQVIREISSTEITSQSLQIGTWVTIFERNGEEYLSPEEILVVKLFCDQPMDLKISYEAGVSIFSPDNLLYLFLPLILK